MAKLYDRKTMMLDKLSNIKIVYFNSRSLRKNLIEIAFIKIKTGVDIIVVGATWLYSDEDKYFNIPGYTASFISNNLSRRGGAAIYVKQGICYKILETSNSFNTIVISLEDTVCYKSPNENKDAFIMYLDQLFDKYKNTILISDTNIDLLSETDVSRRYLDMLDVNSVHIKNIIDFDNATRVTAIQRHLLIMYFQILKRIDLVLIFKRIDLVLIFKRIDF